MAPEICGNEIKSAAKSAPIYGVSLREFQSVCGSITSTKGPVAASACFILPRILEWKTWTICDKDVSVSRVYPGITIFGSCMIVTSNDKPTLASVAVKSGVGPVLERWMNSSELACFDKITATRNSESNVKKSSRVKTSLANFARRLVYTGN